MSFAIICIDCYGVVLVFTKKKMQVEVEKIADVFYFCLACKLRGWGEGGVKAAETS